jgi:hypothetical protein
MRSGLQIVFACRDQIHDFLVLRNDNGFLAVLVLDLPRVPLDFLHLLRDRSLLPLLRRYCEQVFPPWC